MNQFIFFILSFLLFFTSCSPPSELLGTWASDRQECLFSDRSQFFRNDLTDKKRYLLKFMENNQVELVYYGVNITASLLGTADQKKSTEKIECDLTFTGTYSYAFGSISFNFANDETGELMTKKGENCGTNLHIRATKLPEGSSYTGDPSASLESINANELRLAFSGFSQCTKEKLVTILKKQQ